jgi:putative flavoprotein involved in K+ transport
VTLFTSRRYDSLPGLDFPGDPAGYPDNEEITGYLVEYARRFELPVSLNTNVRRLGAGESGGYVIDTDRAVAAWLECEPRIWRRPRGRRVLEAALL